MIKVLFVSSGNSADGISPITKNQGDSLMNLVHLDYFTIDGKGVKGYIKATRNLRKVLSNDNYDIIHAHYSLSAYVASMAGAKPLIVSLMGSDVKSKHIYKLILKIFNFLFWNRIIVKSEDMKNSLKISNVAIIPNGVDFKKFRPLDRIKALKIVNWHSSKKHILFAANPKRPEKNYKLAKAAFDLLDTKTIELHHLEDIPNEKMPYYFNASDVIILTSLWEGSPNVIKEAMACNIPIVATDVGDINKVIGNTRGCYIVENSPKDVSERLLDALKFNRKTNGREAIGYLDSTKTARKIKKIYNSVIN